MGTGKNKAYVILQPDGRKRGKCHIRAATPEEIVQAAEDLSDTEDDEDDEDTGTEVWGRLNHVAPLPPVITKRVKSSIQESGVEDAPYKFVERVAQVYADCHDERNTMHEDRDNRVEDAIKVTACVCISRTFYVCISRTLCTYILRTLCTMS